MNKILYGIRGVRFLRLNNSVKICALPKRNVSDSSKDSQPENTKILDEISISGLAKALGKFRDIEKSDDHMKPEPQEEKSFLNLLRHSEFVQMGDPQGKVVIGKIFQVVNTDLYIDFGGKFHCVCRKPKKNSQLYVRNAEVKIRINELELCARFLGAVEDLTLLEASGNLLELVSTPVSMDSLTKLRNEDN
ncbi:28S ribosomal protein S28, mitochondrial [Trichonephila inaurata madagascariensis]|uniref:28S ribosomal protein S28, mitochondrial n=1 Tax=Trichonephila inaurata madagascariensis TaxID=2747483 RepID=A0A8X7C7V2_9ARAC|nr:28S ribosomal protein S28, mitochondrial [Trichonephila inaurata madagascariensis]